MTTHLGGAAAATGATVLVGIVACLVALAAGGAAQARGAALGTGVVCAFFVLGAVNTGLAAAYAPRASLLVALLTYTVQVVGLGLVMAAVARSAAPDRLDPAWVGGSIVVGTLVWTAALLARLRHRPEVRR